VGGDPNADENSSRRLIDAAVKRGNLEPMTGIEPAYSAWEADVLPLNYIGLFDHEG
jgi:hypothetical protein